MAGSRTIPAASPQAQDPGPWLAAYLRTRAHLASLESDFRCDPACSRPGCKDQDLQVSVSLVDLLGAALHREESVAAIYPRHYSLGLFSLRWDNWIRRVSLKLKKPCPFLENDLCSIYPVRPLPCILFPEYLVCEGRFEAEARKVHFRDYRCFHGPLLLSPERTAMVAKLKKMWQRETLISSFYLFHHGPCLLDVGNLTEELRQAAGSLGEGETAAGAERQTIPHQVLEHFFRERIARCQPFAGVSDKLSQLDNQEGLGQFLQWLQDDRLLQKLRKTGDDRALVFRFVKGKLKAKRRSLIPSEYKFY
jgi:Fe-S-cluster containining protein